MLKILIDGYKSLIDASKTALVFFTSLFFIAFWVIALGLGVLEIIEWVFL